VAFILFNEWPSRKPGAVQLAMSRLLTRYR
jgi:hypothetical protein